MELSPAIHKKHKSSQRETLTLLRCFFNVARFNLVTIENAKNPGSIALSSLHHPLPIPIDEFDASFGSVHHTVREMFTRVCNVASHWYSVEDKLT